MQRAAAPERLCHSASAPLRLVAAIVAALLALSSLSQVAHFVLVPHTVCAEHGELVEVGHEAASHGSNQTTAVPVAPSAELAPQTNGPAYRDNAATHDDAHDHCAALCRSEREQAVVRDPASSILPAPERPAASSVSGVTHDREGREQLSLAPKTSPPQAAAPCSVRA